MEDFSSTTVGMTAARVGRSRRRTASTITRACWRGWGEQEDSLRLRGARYGALRGWAGPEPGELDGRDGALERIRNRADRLIASRVGDNRVNMTRPVCPYPQVAQYTGVGSTNDAANFVCKVR